ncbi:MAG: M15 family metallopeptidase [Oscillospiraceae bacterium]|nr:M15 family metallopeptidase [Oscillospiraceae bacterium]
MKRFLILIILACLLSACAKQEKVKTTLPLETLGAETVVVTETEDTLPVVETTASISRPIPADKDFVRVCDYLPGVSQELMYATEGNFTGQVIYDFQDAYLRYGTVKKLAGVCQDLAEMGLSLKIWDGFRPVSAQFRLWEVCPDPTYVADPNVGYSSHSRGNTVDVTLVDENREELEMPTGFDDFSAKADRDYSDCTAAAANNAEILEILMEKHGFTGYAGEWWHYSDTMSYPVEREFDP